MKSYRLGALSVFSLTSMLTLLLFYYARSDIEQRGRVEFVRNSVQMRSALLNRMYAYVNTLRQAAAHVALQPRLNDEDFAAYVESMAIQRNYPGLQGIGYAALLAPRRVPEFERQTSRALRMAYRVRSHDATVPWCVPIVYLEPDERRARLARGFDMFSDPTRREAMERARDTGEPAMTARLTMAPSIHPDQPVGFIVYVPVYWRGEPLETVSQRRAALRGFVFSAFRAIDLLREIADAPRPEGLPLDLTVAMAVYDGVARDPAHLLYNGLDRGPSRYEQLSSVTLAGRPWTLVVKSRPRLEARSDFKVAWIVLLAGAVFSALVFRLFLSIERNAESEHRLRLREQSARAQAERAVKQREDLVAMVSHDLRNPLSSILMHAAFVRRSPEDHALALKALGAVERAASRMYELIQNLLDLDKLEGGHFTIEKVPHALDDLLASMAETFQPLAEAKGILLTIEKPLEQIEVRCDRMRLLQVMSNLLGNALKFTPPGGRIGLSCACEPEGLRFAVSDTGPGIAPEQLKHIFDRYWQARQTARQGNGLGLSIAKGIVEAHGGRIWVESRVSEGSAFYFLLPASLIYSRMRQDRPAPEHRN